MNWRKKRREETTNQNFPNVDSDQKQKGVHKKTDHPEKSRKKIVILVILLILLVGILFYVFYFKKILGNGSTSSDNGNSNVQIEMNKGNANMVSASGTTSVGIVEDQVDFDYLDTDLLIEKVYLTNNSDVSKGDKILKISDDSLTSATQELENALSEAQIAYNAQEITYKQALIEAKYDYDSAILAGQQAQDVYDATVASLQSDVDDAQSAIDDAQADIDEYTDAINNNTYDEKYGVTDLNNKYQTDLKLLNTKVSEWGLDWSKVTGSSSSTGSSANAGSASGTGSASGAGSSSASGSSSSFYLQTAQGLYQEVTEEAAEYETAKSEYDSAMTTAKYGLQKLQVQMTSLQNALTTAKNAYDEGVIEAKSTYNETVATAKIAQDTYDTAVKKAQEELDSLQSDLDDAQDNIDNFNNTIGDGYMYAPSNGTVLHVEVEAATNLNDYSKVIVYSNSDEMTVSASVDQADINELTVGESAMVTIEDYGNFSGTITAINPVSSSTSKSSITYTVTITLDGDVSSLKENLTCTVIFGMGGDSNEKTGNNTVSGNDAVSGNEETKAD